MKKMPCLFVRDFAVSRLVTPEVTPGCEWVLEGKGTPTIKLDGTSCLVKDGLLYRRYDAKHGKTPPANFMPAQEAPDEVTGHWPGWLPVGDEPESRWHREAFASYQPLFAEHPCTPGDWTYELVGPKVQGNPYRMSRHVLERHGDGVIYLLGDRTYESIQFFLEHHEVEGIVFWEDPLDPDCRKCKIRRNDFGFAWPVK